jgi:hypothetical protein
MPNNDIEVFEHLTVDQETALEIDYLTYAIFAYKKKHWIAHFQKRHGKAPSQAEIDEWISQLTDYDFSQMRDEAANYFQFASREYLQEYIEDQKNEAVNSSILNEVRLACTRFG